MIFVCLSFSSIQFNFLHTVSVTINNDSGCFTETQSLTRKQGQLVQNLLTCRDPAGTPADGRLGKGAGEESRGVERIET